MIRSSAAVISTAHEAVRLGGGSDTDAPGCSSRALTRPPLARDRRLSRKMGAEQAGPRFIGLGRTTVAGVSRVQGMGVLVRVSGVDKERRELAEFYADVTGELLQVLLYR